MAVLLHMYRSDRRAYDPLLPHLLKAGFATLAIDMRGHGESVEPKAIRLADRVARRDASLFRSMDRDVAAAYQFLRREHGSKVDLSRFVLVGASVGCSVALKYAAKDRSVDGVVCMTPGTDYLGIDSLEDAGKCKGRPILLLASEVERQACDALARKMGEGAKIEIFKGRLKNPMEWHGTRMFGPVKGIEKIITDFLIAAAGKPATQPVIAGINSDVYHKPDSSTVERIKLENRRWFNSSAEAEARGLRASKRE
jgi:pimeloyl-ACP methyl ester carboxylesterase